MKVKRDKTRKKTKYSAHRYDAERRGIEFLLTFEEWVKIWLDSGHFHERGTRKGQYVMARFGDAGPYSVGNVRITTVEENHSEANLKIDISYRFQPHSSEVRKKISDSNKGKKRTAETRLRISIAKKKSFLEKKQRNACNCINRRP